MPDDVLTPVVMRLLSGRIGSTLLMQLFVTSPHIAFDRVYPFENRYLSDLLHLFGPHGKAYDPHDEWARLTPHSPTETGPFPFQPTSIDPVRFQREAFRATWAAFTTEVRRHNPDATMYAEKFVGNIGLVRDAGIPVKTVELVRDPRDVLASIRAFNRKRGFDAFGRQPGQTDAQYFESYVNLTGRKLAEMGHDNPDTILVRYEDMIEDLEGVAGRLSTFLGVELSAAQVHASREVFRPHMTTGGSSDSIGRWRVDISPMDARDISDAMRDDMVRLGYEP